MQEIETDLIDTLQQGQDCDCLCKVVDRSCFGCDSSCFSDSSSSWLFITKTLVKTVVFFVAVIVLLLIMVFWTWLWVSIYTATDIYIYIYIEKKTIMVVHFASWMIPF